MTDRPPTLGPHVVAWIERFLTHGEGEYLGQPIQLDPWQKAILYRLYEFDADTLERIVTDAVLMLPKGAGKTPLAAAVAAVELFGPTVPGDPPQMRPSPNIPIAAAGYDQADNVYGAFRLMVGGPTGNSSLSAFVEMGEQRTAFKDRPGVVQRIAAVGGRGDGKLPSCTVRDELHEWLEDRHVYTANVLANNGEKRKMHGGHHLLLDISTAGYRKDSVMGHRWAYGEKLAAGEHHDPSFLYVNYSAPVDLDLNDPAELRRGLAAAYPASWINTEVLARKWERPSEDEAYDEASFRRYFFNQWTASTRQWLPFGAWEAVADPGRHVPDGTEIVVGLDGSWSRDSTAIYAWTMDDRPHGWLAGLWEKPDDLPGWRVNEDDVDATVRDLFHRFTVRLMYGDPAAGWDKRLGEWAAEFGADRVLMLPQSNQRMGPACNLFYTAVVSKDVTHDGDPAMLRHLTNCVPKPTRFGVTVHKDHPDSPRRIDAAIAAISAFKARVEAPGRPANPSVMLV